MFKIDFKFQKLRFNLKVYLKKCLKVFKIDFKFQNFKFRKKTLKKLSSIKNLAFYIKLKFI